MTATDELLTLLKEQGFEHYKHEVPAEEDCVAFYDGNRWHDCWESVDGEVNVTFSMTPEQAVAATVGRDERESYDAGFASGMKATLQQLYGLLHEYPTLDEIEAWADSQWEEYE